MKTFHMIRPSYFVGAGSTDLFEIYSNGHLYRAIKQIHNYSANSAEGPHDLVLIETLTPFELGPKYNIYAACLLDEVIRSFKDIVVTGFGRTSSTLEPVEQIERIKELQTMMKIIATDNRGSIDLSLDDGSREQLDPDMDFDTFKAKMRAFSRYLTLTNLDEVVCASNKSNKGEQAYFTCQGYPQKSLACIGNRSLIDLR